MRRKLSAGAALTLALLIPAAPAPAQAATPGLDASCQTVERKVFTDIRTLITIDLDKATDTEVRLLGNQILSAAKNESLGFLARATQTKLDLEDKPEELRGFLKGSVRNAWKVALDIAVGNTMTKTDSEVNAAAAKALNDGSIDATLKYLNEDLYAARELDCKSQPSASPTVTPGATPSPTSSVSPSASPSVTSTGGAGAGENTDDGLPVTGSDTGTVAAVGGALLLLGGGGYLIGRRRRARFEV